MKKLFTLLTFVAVALIANAYPVTITVDDASHIDRLEYNHQVYKFTGNTLELEANVNEAAQLYFADPWAMDPSSHYQNMYPDADDPYDYKFGCDYQTVVDLYLYSNSGYEWSKYFVNTVNMADLRTNSFTVNVHGDPAKVSMQYSVSYYEPKLVEGENKLKFWSKEGDPLVIKSVDSNDALYQVWLNGDNIADSDYEWNFLLLNGDIIDIYTEWPDKDVTVTLTLNGDASVDDILSYKINNVDADPTAPVTAKMGQSYFIQFDCILKEITSVKVNGEPYDMGWNTTYSTRLASDFNFEITMKKKPCWTANVTVDNPSHIVYNVGGGKRVYPEEKNFTIEVPAETSYSIGIEPRDASCSIVSVELDGKKQSVSGGSCYVYLTKDNQTINITTKGIDRKETLIFYIDSPEKSRDKDKGLLGWWVLLNDYSYQQEIQENVKAGYNEIPFNLADCPFEFGVSCYAEGQWVYVYLNNEAWDLAPSEYSWKFMPEDKDVLKMYIAEEANVGPERSSVKFSVADPEAVVSTLVDGVTEVAVGNDMVIADQLPGTLFEMTLARGYEVLVNDVRIEPDEDGVCSFEVNGDLNVNVRKDAGIEDVTVTEPNTDAPIYNLMGVKVSDGSTDNLPAGIYVSKGAKIRVK